MSNTMKKKEFVDNYIKPYLKDTDKPGNRQLWNDTIDYLIRYNRLTKRAQNWTKTPVKYYGEN